MPEQKERVIEVTLDSNEVVYVRRLSPLAQQLMIERAKELYPLPKPEDYIRPLSDIAPNAVEGLTIPAEQNPEYQKAQTEAKARQNAWLKDAFIEAGVVVDTPEGREATIERYAERIGRLGSMLPMLTDQPGREWEMTVLYGLITTRADKEKIGAAATGILTGAELHAALCTFRREL